MTEPAHISPIAAELPALNAQLQATENNEGRYNLAEQLMGV
jgi:hypothetical protein